MIVVIRCKKTRKLIQRRHSLRSLQFLTNIRSQLALFKVNFAFIFNFHIIIIHHERFLILEAL